MASRNREIDKVEKQYDEFVKLRKRGADPCDLQKKAEKVFRAPVQAPLIEDGEPKLKDRFETLIEELAEACENR